MGRFLRGESHQRFFQRDVCSVFKACCEILRTKSGKVFELVTDDEMYFNWFFMCLKGCINWFMEGCRPFLGLDEAHMASRYKGVLLAIAAIDADNHIFPLAFGLVEGEFM